MAGTSVIKNMPSHDLLSELRTFVSGATRSMKTNPLEFARTALSLLKTLPAARDAVLEYFCTLFDSAVDKYITDVQMMVSDSTQPGSVSYEEATITEIHNVLCSFVSLNPEAWAPIISTWSLELLGELSSRYTGMARAPMAAGLNESLQLWMSCRATRTLIDITTQCFSCLMHSDTDSCINALLDTSVAHSPHFDWVVAHVGGCFPHTVITKVLSCGLKDFSQHASAEQGAKSPKLISVVGILGHLAGSHFVDIRTALLELFKWSMEPGDVEEADQRKATVPFLFQLASVSSTLLRALTTGVLQTLDVTMLAQLGTQAPGWCEYFGSAQALEGLVVHLALGCEEGGTRILKLLLNAATLEEGVTQNVCTTARRILELLLQEVDQQLRCTLSANIALLGCIQQEVSVIQPLLMEKDNLQVLTAVRLIALIGNESPAVLIGSAAQLLQKASSEDHLVALVRLIAAGPIVNQVQNIYMVHVLEQAIRETSGPGSSPENLWKNVVILLRWERAGAGKVLRGKPVSRAVLANLDEVTNLLGTVSGTCAHSVATAVDLALNGATPFPSTQLLLMLSKAIVRYFFLCLQDSDVTIRLRGARLCCRLLGRLSVHSSPTRALALREILEKSLFHSHSHLFGAKMTKSPVTKTNQDTSLLHDNQRQGSSTMLAQRHSSVFHAGVIGDGPRVHNQSDALSSDIVAHNSHQLINLLKAVCTNNIGGVSLDAMTMVSLLLVELISPDVTIERDLHVRRRFDDLPLVWELMSLVATNRPTLCYCSVLLRAVTATLLAQWGSSGHHWQQSKHRAKLLYTTEKLLQLLSLGQLLPPPLSSLGDVVGKLSPHEVVQLLRDCVWNYLRDHVPSPALFGRDDLGVVWRDPSQAWPGPQYIETFRLILQTNIEQLGALYSQLFLAPT
uniref:(California timema) hypothetical protein n=1 Tax=Timema californicum TaxID=61474 RepID=A0A7R9J840_TIMCA|nr:unnamed protein product [Timema californicum]